MAEHALMASGKQELQIRPEDGVITEAIRIRTPENLMNRDSGFHPSQQGLGPYSRCNYNETHRTRKGEWTITSKPVHGSA